MNVLFILRRLQTITESSKNESKKRVQSKVSDTTISNVTFLLSRTCVYFFAFCCHSFGLSIVSISMKICNGASIQEPSSADSDTDAAYAESQRQPSLSSEDLTDEDESYVSSSICKSLWCVSSL